MQKNQTEIDLSNQYPEETFFYLSSIVYGQEFMNRAINVPWKYLSMIFFSFNR